jgi:broad specificity phosphatase PhoE
MRYLEVRRHAMRVKPGQHLSQEGVDLARRVGNLIGPFEFVITSTLHRTYETSIAMGFAVNDQLDELNAMQQSVEIEVGQGDADFAVYGEAYQRGGAVTAFADQQAMLWQSIVEGVTDGGTALVITHGGIVEAGAVACFPGADHRAWGPAISYCEGIRLHFDGDRFVQIDILRVTS